MEHKKSKADKKKKKTSAQRGGLPLHQEFGGLGLGWPKTASTSPLTSQKAPGSRRDGLREELGQRLPAPSSKKADGGYRSTRPPAHPGPPSPRLAPARCKTKDAYQEPAGALRNLRLPRRALSECLAAFSWNPEAGPMPAAGAHAHVLSNTEDLSKTPRLRHLELQKRVENRYSPSLTAQERQPSLHGQRNAVPSEPID